MIVTFIKLSWYKLQSFANITTLPIICMDLVELIAKNHICVIIGKRIKRQYVFALYTRLFGGRQFQKSKLRRSSRTHLDIKYGLKGWLTCLKKKKIWILP